MIQMKNVTKVYHSGQPAETHALRGIDLEIYDSEFVAIMGPSGCGKSTLLNIIGCMDKLTTGEYYLDGEAIHTKRSLNKTRMDKISFVFQNFALLDKFTVYENIELPLLASKIPYSKRKQLIRKNMEQLGIQDFGKKYPRQLSGGQKQRVAIARAMVMDAPILLADEPTGSLDQDNGKQVMHYVDMLNKQGKTVIMVTHDPSIASMANRTIHMLDGVIV